MSAAATKRAACVIAPDPEQGTFSGVTPVTIGERLGWLAEQPLRAQRPQRTLDIGFWDPMRNQLEMF